MTRTPADFARQKRLVIRWVMGVWWAMGAIALALTVAGGWSLYGNALIHERWLGATLAETTGIVDKLESYRTRSRNRSDTTSTYMTYRYEVPDAQGMPVGYTRQQHVRHWGPIGSSVAVRYVVGRPRIVSLAEDDSDLTMAVLPFAISGLFWTLFLLPAFLTWRYRRRQGPPPKTLPGSSLKRDPPRGRIQP
jgi:hypothetical protein